MILFLKPMRVVLTVDKTKTGFELAQIVDHLIRREMALAIIMDDDSKYTQCLLISLPII